MSLKLRGSQLSSSKHLLFDAFGSISYSGTELGRTGQGLHGFRSPGVFMELYYKDLISEEASLERLVDDLMLVVQGADEFAGATSGLSEPKKEEIRSRLQQLREHCLQLKQRAIATAQATDKALRHHPYSSIGLAFGLGFLAAWLLKPQRRVK